MTLTSDTEHRKFKGIPGTQKRRKGTTLKIVMGNRMYLTCRSTGIRVPTPHSVTNRTTNQCGIYMCLTF